MCARVMSYGGRRSLKWKIPLRPWKGHCRGAEEMTRASSPPDVKKHLPAPEDCPDLQRRPCCQEPRQGLKWCLFPWSHPHPCEDEGPSQPCTRPKDTPEKETPPVTPWTRGCASPAHCHCPSSWVTAEGTGVEAEVTEPSEAQGYETNNEANIRFYTTFIRFRLWCGFTDSCSAWGPL